MTSDAPSDRIPTEAELNLASNLAFEANQQTWIHWQSYLSEGKQPWITEALSKLAIELTKALVRTPNVKDWFFRCKTLPKKPLIEAVGREFLTAHEAALGVVCDALRAIHTAGTSHRFVHSNQDAARLGTQIRMESRQAIDALPDGKEPATGTAKPPSREQQPTKTVRRLNVQKVQGSERCFKIDRTPIKLSPACANLLNGFTALNESNTPATPANLMAKLSPRYDSNRKRFEDDKGRFNDALEAAGIAKGLYVVGDVFQLCKPPKKTPAKLVKKNGMKTVGRR